MSTIQYQYTCRVCGNIRFVDADSEGMKLYEEIGFRPHLVCPPCCAERESKYVQKPKKVTDPNQEAITKWIPEGYQDNDPAIFPPAWAKCRMWIPTDKGLLIYGPTRRCKSRMAYEIVRKAIKLNLDVEAYDCRTFRASVEERIQKGTLWEWMRKLEKTSVFLLDDLGKFKGDGKRIEEELFNVVKLRIEAKKSIIVTTNDTPAMLSRRFSDSIAEPLIARLIECCTPVSVFNDGEEALTTEPELSMSGPDL